VERLRSDTTIEVGPEPVKRMAKLYVALRALLESNRLAAAGHNCWTSIQSEYGISGCTVFSLLEEDGWPITCETDVYGAATMLLQRCVGEQAGDRRRPFFMDWTIRHPGDANVFQAWHCGKAPISVFKSRPAIRVHEILDPIMGPDHASGTLEGEFRPGPVTLFRLVEYGGKFRGVITRGTIEAREWPDMRGSWGWVRVRDLASLYRVLIEKGFSHHVSLMYGDHAEATAAACELLGAEVVWVE
jgi:L-fucose isomerase-like protein